MKNQTEYSGLTFEVEYDFYEGEEPCSDCPGRAPRVDINSIKLLGVEVYDLLTESTISAIEAQIYWEFHGSC